MESKIKIKIGPIEIEYEGSEAFLKEELPALIAAVTNLHRESGISDSVETPTPIIENNNSSDSIPKGNTLNLTTGSIAARLNVKTGPELILAAAARLSLSLGQENFSRSQLSNEMKSASAYYKQTYMKNLTGSLNRLLKEDKLFEISKDKYSISASTRSDMESRLVQ